MQNLIGIYTEIYKRNDSYYQMMVINSQAREILNRYKKHLGPIFRFKTETWVSQKFRGYVEKAGFNGHRFHDLRHAFGTALVKAGEDIHTIQKLMRHESIQSTLVYAKVLPEHLIKASNNLNYGFSAEDIIKKKQELKKTGTQSRTKTGQQPRTALIAKELYGF